jgi:AcrR family transcriptional regulator
MRSSGMPGKRPRPPVSRRGRYDRSASAAARRSEQHLKLLDFATQVLAANGFAETTVEAIVSKAGMSRRTFYEHFVDLRDVLSQVYDRAAAVAYTMVAHHSRAEVDPLVQIRSGLAAYYSVVAEYPDVARVMFLEYRMAGREFEARYQADSLRYGTMLFESLVKAHAQGRIAKQPTEAAVHVLFKGVEMLAVSRVMTGAQAELPGLVPAIADLIIDAFVRVPAA